MTLKPGLRIFINPYGDIKNSDAKLQEELIGISTNEEPKVSSERDTSSSGFRKI